MRLCERYIVPLCTLLSLCLSGRLFLQRALFSPMDRQFSRIMADRCGTALVEIGHR